MGWGWGVGEGARAFSRDLTINICPHSPTVQYVYQGFENLNVKRPSIPRPLEVGFEMTGALARSKSYVMYKSAVKTLLILYLLRPA